MVSRNGSKRKVIFTAYNKMRREGADKGRLNRALGLAQRKQGRPYTTTAESCDCKDFQFRGGPCKHQLSLQLVAPAVEPAPTREKVLADVNSFLFGD